MKNDKIIASWNKIEPGDFANDRMLSAIMERNRSAHGKKDEVKSMLHTTKAKKTLISAAACLVVFIMAAGILGSNLGWFSPKNPTVNPGTEDAVLPPTRIGEPNVNASFGHRYTFESASAEADAVARIVVGNWLGEDTDLHKTYYEATVVQCFKGDLPEKITLLQDGCSSGTLKAYPLFTSGNELLVFINRASVTDYVSPYWIIGAFTTLLDVSYDSAGTRYYVDPYGILGDTIDISANYASDPVISREVYNSMAENDPIWKEMEKAYPEVEYTFPYIFSEDDLIPLLTRR